MPRVNKYLYLFVVQGLYPGPHGWEDVGGGATWREARDDIRAYRNNAPEYTYRVIRRREPNPAHASSVPGASA